MMESEDGNKLYAVVRIRGSVKTNKPREDALEKLRLKKVNNCVLVPADPTNDGMLKNVAGDVTWGGIKKEILVKLIELRGRNMDGSRLDSKFAKSVADKILKGKSPVESGIQPVFRLSPPKKGLRSLKRFYPSGDLGPRGENINDLLLRMV